MTPAPRTLRVSAVADVSSVRAALRDLELRLRAPGATASLLDAGIVPSARSSTVVAPGASSRKGSR